MEKLNSSISECIRSVSGNGWWRTAVNVTSTLADKFGIDFRRADYNSNGEPDEFEKDEEMEMIPTAVGKWDKLDSYDMGNAKSFKTLLMMVVGDNGDLMQESSAESDIDDHVRKNVVGG